MEVDLSPFTVIFMYLLPSALDKLKTKLEIQLEAGKTIITILWPINGWENYQRELNGSYFYSKK
jgi:hypothetical protein